MRRNTFLIVNNERVKEENDYRELILLNACLTILIRKISCFFRIFFLEQVFLDNWMLCAAIYRDEEYLSSRVKTSWHQWIEINC